MNKKSFVFPEENRWFCIQTKPRSEDFASVEITQRNIVVFNPKIEELNKTSTRIAPLFPGYIFANFSLAADYYKILWAPGVKRILGNGTFPTPIWDEQVIYLIMDRLENNDFIRPQFRPGDAVKFTKGPFSELIGVFEKYCADKERVKILLKLFNHPMSVECNVTAIERLSDYGC